VTSAFPSDPSGLAPALSQGAALAAGDGQGDAAVQGSLFGVDPVEPDGIGELDIEAAPRGRGWPAGSRNRSTEDWSRFLLSRYRSPLVGLAELAQMTPKALQTELGGAPVKDGIGDSCTLTEAVRLIMAAQQALAPYLHQKQPLAIDGGGVGMLQVIIHTGDGSETGQAIDIQPIEETVEYQALTKSGVDLSEPSGRNE
jgi:hypothetical protein